jgi:hypothetical protein
MNNVNNNEGENPFSDHRTSPFDIEGIVNSLKSFYEVDPDDSTKVTIKYNDLVSYTHLISELILDACINETSKVVDKVVVEENKKPLNFN